MATTARKTTKKPAAKKPVARKPAAKNPSARKPAASQTSVGSAQADFNAMMEEFMDHLKAYQPQGVDISSFMETRQRQFESLTAMNQQAIDGFQTIAKLQQEILEETMKQAGDAAKAIAKAGNAGDLAQVQSAFLRDAFDKALANMQRLAEAVNASHQQTLQTASDEFNKSLEELTSLGKQLRP